MERLDTAAADGIPAVVAHPFVQQRVRVVEGLPEKGDSHEIVPGVVPESHVEDELPFHGPVAFGPVHLAARGVGSGSDAEAVRIDDAGLLLEDLDRTTLDVSHFDSETVAAGVTRPRDAKENGKPQDQTDAAGLGLTASKWIVESCGGKLFIDSSRKGTVCTVRLPVFFKNGINDISSLDTEGVVHEKLLGTALAAHKQIKSQYIINLFIPIIRVISIIILIPLYGIYGAITAQLIQLFSSGALSYYYFRKI